MTTSVSPLTGLKTQLPLYPGLAPWAILVSPLTGLNHGVIFSLIVFTMPLRSLESRFGKESCAGKTRKYTVRGLFFGSSGGSILDEELI